MDRDENQANVRSFRRLMDLDNIEYSDDPSVGFENRSVWPDIQPQTLYYYELATRMPSPIPGIRSSAPFLFRRPGFPGFSGNIPRYNFHSVQNPGPVSYAGSYVPLAEGLQESERPASPAPSCSGESGSGSKSD